MGSYIFNQLLIKIDSHFPPLSRPHWKEENQGFLTVYGMPMDNFFPKNPLIGKLCEGGEGGVDLDELGQLAEVTDVVVEMLKIYVEDEVGVS